MGKINTLFRLLKNRDFPLICREIKRVIGYLPKYPTNLFVGPNNTCNLKCPLCTTGAGKMNRTARHMSFEEFKPIIDQVRGHTKDMTIHSYGEPFLNKDIFRMINYAVKADISVLASTNGTLFDTDETCMNVLDSGLQHLVITLDGADQETLVQYRVGANFDQILSGYRRLLALKKSLNRKLPVIELQFIVMKHNEHQKLQVRQLAESLGVDIFCEKSVGIDYREPSQVKKFMPSDGNGTRYTVTDDGSCVLKGEMLNSCSWLHTACIINSDGSVIPCCYDLLSAHIMGNVFTDSLDKIWKGASYRAFRSQLKKNRKGIPICNFCSEGRYDTSLRSTVI